MYSSQARPSSIPTDEEELGQQLSSLPPSSPPRSGHFKEKKAPSITPRRFTRFFTPRSNGSSTKSSRRLLFDVGSATNARSPAQSSPLKPFSPANGQENTPPPFTRDLKRRKVAHTAVTGTDCGNAEKGLFALNILPSIERADPVWLTEDELENAAPSNTCQNIRYTENGRIDDTFFLAKPIQFDIPKPIERFSSRGLHGSRLEREIGTGRPREVDPITDWQAETAAFYTKNADVYETRSIARPGAPCVPFCVEGNQDGSVVAVGDEEGFVRLLKTNLSKSTSGNLQSVANFRAHTNAIIDVAWSGDGRRIATASGDQTGKITDLEKQKPMVVLSQHTASLKQIRFQPGNDHILATSGRDGSVQMWDLRCKGAQGPVMELHMPLEVQNSPPLYGCATGDIYDAHHTSSSLWGGPANAGQEVSVTALQFLPQGREHLFLTASNSNAAVKLWDIRCIRPSTSRGVANLALSQTAQPILHKGYRDFGVSSMTLSGDGSRLFTVNKDSTIYAYSTANLLLGSAPELEAKPGDRPRLPKEIKIGKGPLYGYRHPDLNVGTFYIKSAIRAARNGKSELLAVGNSNGSAILIPTDEKHHSYQPMRSEVEMKRIMPQKLAAKGAADVANDFPIYHNATTLVRGHEKEIGAVTWTSEGNLVTVDDEYVVRCWREDAETARDLRTGGEGEGRRWAAGWAEVCGDYDNEFY